MILSDSEYTKLTIMIISEFFNQVKANDRIYNIMCIMSILKGLENIGKVDDRKEGATSPTAAIN